MMRWSLKNSPRKIGRDSCDRDRPCHFDFWDIISQMSVERGPSNFIVESSHALRDKEQEAVVKTRFLQGYERGFGARGPLSQSVIITLQRERPQSKNLPIFEMREPEVDQDSGSLHHWITLYPDIIERDVAVGGRFIESIDYPQGLKLDEGGVAEMIGMYLKLWLMREASLDVAFAGKQLSHYKRTKATVGGLSDELWGAVVDQYFVEQALSVR